MTDAFVPYLIPDKDGYVDAEQLNRAVRQLAEAINALAGRTGAVTIEDSTTINGDLTVNGEASIVGDVGISGDLLPGADDTYDIGRTEDVDPLRWRDLNISRDINLNKQDSAIRFDVDDNNVTIQNDSAGVLSIGSEGAQDFTTLILRNTFGVPPLDGEILFNVDFVGSSIDTNVGAELTLKNGGSNTIILTDRNFRQESANGALWRRGQASEEVTITAVPTDSSANLLPANSLIQGVCVRVTESITQGGGDPTNLRVGDPTTVNRFINTFGFPIAGATGVGLDHWSGAVATLATGPSQASAAVVRLTPQGGAGAVTGGKVRVTVFYSQFVAPTS